MNQLREGLQQLRSLYVSECLLQPFPYREVRALTCARPDAFGHLEQANLASDLQGYLQTLHGWASGGIRRWLDDPHGRLRAEAWLAKDFFGHHPVYRFLRDADLAAYPSLQRELQLAEQLRALLRRVVDQSRQPVSA